MNREQTLHEMGLGPFWKLRVPPADTAAPDAVSVSSVTSAGDVHVDWFFVGEEPGMEDEPCGEPFAGQAGELFDAMLASIGLARGQDVYITNAVKCRPPENRALTAEEIAAGRSHLEQQIALRQPKLIVALGESAVHALLQQEVKIAAARGKLHTCDGIPVIVSYHPAYLLRNLLDKAKAWEDLCFMRRTMRQLKAAP